MKTRRILAASTAAMLAFGTTAIVSTTASATVGDNVGDYKDVTVEISVDEVAKNATEDDVIALVTVKGKECTTAAVSGGSAAVFADTATTLTSDKYDIRAELADGKWTVTVEAKTGGPELAAVTGGDLEVTVSVADFNSTKITYNKNGVDIGEGLMMYTSSATNVNKNFKNYTIETKVEALSNDGEYVDPSKTNTLKGLDDDLQDQFYDLKTNEVKIVNIDIFDGNKVISSTKEAIEFTIDLDYDAHVYHVNGKKLEEVSTKSARVRGGYQITFEAKEFSPYIFTKTAIEGAKAAPATSNTSGTSAATSGAASTTNPDTGIALAIAPVVLAAGAVAVVALKKKH